MTTLISFDEFEEMYKSIIDTIEIENAWGTLDRGARTSLEKPLAFYDNNIVNVCCLSINSKYFENNTKSMIDLVIDAINSTTNEEFRLAGDALITEDVINAIISNQNIKKVKLLSSKGLSKKQIELLINSGLENISCTIDYDKYPEMLYEYSPKLDVTNYPLIENVGISDFGKNEVKLIIENELSTKELERLKGLFEKYPQDSVSIDFICDYQMREILDVVKAKRISIVDDPGWEKETYELFDNNFTNVVIHISDKVSVLPHIMVEKEKILDSIVSEVKSLNLSPLEEYMYLYNVVKMFKEYREVENLDVNATLSREPVYILFNDYIVCQGYALLLDELVQKLDDPNLTLTTYSCLVEDGVVVESHRRCIVKIEDDKYEIEGIYISDPTWDSVSYYDGEYNKDDEFEPNYDLPIAHHDLYNHFLMTKEEVLDEIFDYPYPDITDVLFKPFAPIHPKEIKSGVYEEAYDVIMDLNNCGNMSKKRINTEIENILHAPVSSNIIMDAVKEVYTKLYYGDESQIESLVQKTMEVNHQKQQERFNKFSDKFNIESSKKM